MKGFISLVLCVFLVLPVLPVRAEGLGVVIFEVQAAGATANDEFIRIYNPTAATVDLSAWSIQYKSAAGSSYHKKNFVEGMSVEPGGFFVVAHNDFVGVADMKHGSFSMAASGSAFLVAGQSVLDGEDFSLVASQADWQDLEPGTSWTAAEEPAEEDPAEEEEDEDEDGVGADPDLPQEEEQEEADSDGEMIITELFPNPEDEDDEYIEIKNAGTEEVLLEGWQLADGTGDYDMEREDFDNLTVEPGEYFVIPRSVSKLSLNNGGEAVHLYNPAGVLKDVISYASAPEGKSYCLGVTGLWEWSQTRTPGEPNRLEPANHPPVARMKVEGTFVAGQEILLDASSSYDEDGDELLFAWSFGDGTSASKGSLAKIYVSPGTFKITLLAYDSRGAVGEAAHELEISGSEAASLSEVIIEEQVPEEEEAMEEEARETAITSIVEEESATGFVAPRIVISAVLPNPVGDDGAEWIELFNAEEGAVDISGWQLDDEDGGSKAFLVPSGTLLPPGAFMVFSRQETGISLNNGGDEVRLLDGQSRLLQSVSYDGSTEGSALVYYDGEYFWQEIGVDDSAATYYQVSDAVAEITVAGLDMEVEEIVEDGEETAPVGAQNSVPLQEEEENSDIVSIVSAKAAGAGTKATVRAQVSVLPGTFGTQYAYIQDATGGIQLYQHQKGFPSLAVGDTVEVSGELSESRGELRLKAKSRQDIRLVGEEGTLAAAPIAALSAVHVGKLVEVSGEVIEKKGDSLYLEALGGELEVSLKSKEVVSKEVKAATGDSAMVSGILFQSEGLFSLKPRTNGDIFITPAVAAGQEEEEKEEEGARAGGDTLNFASGAGSLEWWHVAGLVLVFLSFAGLLGWEYVKRRREKVDS